MRTIRSWFIWTRNFELGTNSKFLSLTFCDKYNIVNSDKNLISSMYHTHETLTSDRIRTAIIPLHSSGWSGRRGIFAMTWTMSFQRQRRRWSDHEVLEVGQATVAMTATILTVPEANTVSFTNEWKRTFLICFVNTSKNSADPDHKCKCNSYRRI